MNKQIKDFIKSHANLLSRIYFVIMNNKVRGVKGNIFRKNNAFIRGLRLCFYGKGNEIIIGGERPSSIMDCQIEVHGSNHKIFIDSGVGAIGLKLYCADSGCMIHIKENTQISGNTELAVMEGTKIVVGRDCLFSANITLRAGDSHSVIDAKTGSRLNQSKDIIIGDHVWIGNTVIITKGSEINPNSVVATGSIVSGKSYPGNTVIGGNPARVIKEGTNWLAEKV